MSSDGGQKEDDIAEHEIQEEASKKDQEGDKEAHEVHMSTPKTTRPHSLALEAVQTLSAAHTSFSSSHYA